MNERTPRLERFLEQAARIASGGSFHPVAVLQAVQDAALGSVRDGALANGYVVAVPAGDFEQLRQHERALRSGLGRLLDETQASGQLSRVGPWQIEFEPGASLRPGEVAVAASFRNPSVPAAAAVAGATRVITRHRGKYIVVAREGRVPLSHTPFVIGRSPGCDLTVHDPSVSRRHASVETAADGSIWIRDLGSRNRLLVNGERSDEVRLAPGFPVTLGDTTIWLEVDE